MARLPQNQPEEAISEEEITGTAIPDTTPVDAFAELMSKKKPKQDTKAKSTPLSRPDQMARNNIMDFSGRDGLGAYTANPDAFDRVLYHNARVVVINDMYPKSSVHILVLPTSPRNLLHPFDAFKDVRFLDEIKAEVEIAKGHVANELRRRYGHLSRSEQPRIQARDSDDPPDQLPEGRDWTKEVITGIHAKPSMNHLHVHVMSRDMVSAPMRRHSHYSSFTTPFLVPLEKFPLPENDPAWESAHEGYLSSDMHCWRCGRNFKNKFTKLKEHLEGEFEEWKRE